MQKKWSFKNLRLEAGKYHTRQAFRVGSPGAYSAAWKQGLLEKVCSNMTPQIRKRLSLETVRKIAERCKTRAEFKKLDPSAYNWARRNNHLETACAHMTAQKRPNGYWTKERIRTASKPFSTIKEFRAHFPGAYSTAKAKRWLRECLSDLKPAKPNRRYWTLERIHSAAKEYRFRSDFEKGNPAAYNAALKHKAMDNVCAHMEFKQRPKGYWNRSKIFNLAKKYTHISDFKSSESAAYAAVKKLGLMDELRTKLNSSTRPPIWTKENVLMEARKFTRKSEFSLKSPGAYAAAQRNDWFVEACEHMEIVGNRFKRALYAYEFSDRSVYVGLTFDYEQRLRQHKKIGPVKEHARRHSFKFRRFNKWYDLEKAQRAEESLILRYKSQGWKILNSARAGALGGMARNWTEERIKAAVKSCKTLTDFRKKYPGAYQKAAQNGSLEKVTRRLKRARAIKAEWTKQTILKLAKKYKTYRSFIKNQPLAYHYSVVNGWINAIKSNFRK